MKKEELDKIYKRECNHGEMLAWKKCPECRELLVRQEISDLKSSWIDEMAEKIEKIKPCNMTNEELRKEFWKEFVLENVAGTEIIDRDKTPEDCLAFWLSKIKDLKPTLDQQHAAALQALVKTEIERLDGIKREMKETHICRFNDGQQNCDCYLEAIDDQILHLKELLTKR